MKKTTTILGFCFILSSCQQKPDCTITDPALRDPTCEPLTEDTTQNGSEDVVEDSSEAREFTASYKLVNFEKEDELKVEKAIDLIQEVVRSPEFKARVLNFAYQGKKTFVDNLGLTNEAIYQRIIEGSEELKPGKDYQMDVELELYYSSKSTVGYTYETSPRIWMNTKFFDSYTTSEVAGNVFHEWTHKLGFDHAASYSTARDSSVPYALGYLMEELTGPLE